VERRVVNQLALAHEQGLLEKGSKVCLVLSTGGEIVLQFKQAGSKEEATLDDPLSSSSPLNGASKRKK
jgi:hypothetical protein